jgi:integrase
MPLAPCSGKRLWVPPRPLRDPWGKRGIRVGEASNPGPVSTFEPLRKRPRIATQDPESLPALANPIPWAQPPLGQERSDLSLMTCAADLARDLWNDPSPFAICRGNFPMLSHACEIAFSTAADAFSLRTSKQDVGHWAAWDSYCSVMNTTPLRPIIEPTADRLSFLRELVLLTNALCYFMRTRRPSSHSNKVIKPQSAMNILLGANRVLKRNFRAFIPLKALTLPLKGLMRQFVQQFGPKSLIPKRRSPFTNGMIQTLLTLPAGLHLGGFGPLNWGNRAGLSLRAAFTVAISSGMRKAELFQSDSETFFLTWTHISWYIQGRHVARPTLAQLLALSESDFMLIIPPPSKADQFGVVWGSTPIYLPFRDTLRNAARAVRALLVHIGVDSYRDTDALFTSSSGRPLQASVMARALFLMVSSFMPAEAAKLFTWHSGRVYLATALHAAGVKPGVIQALLRWQTEESLRLYALLSRDEAAAHLDSAARANIASVRSSALPIFEQFDLFVALNEVAIA